MNLDNLGKPAYDPILGKMRLANVPGAGIDMSGGTISVITPPDGVPYVAGEGIAINGATIGADLDAGYRMEIVSGSTIGQQRYFPIETVTGSSVTLQAGHAYKVYANSTAITLNTETVPDGKFGLEGHLEIYIAGTGYVVTGTNVVLAEALEPDAVNNCTLRFHDGVCIISVEDHVAGYIVVSATGTSAGTLYYALGTASEEYVAVDASLNGTTLDLGGVTTYAGEKHVVGNGYADTILTGGVSCTSKTTFANLTMSNVVNSGGTMTLGDVFIPSGATVTISSGAIVAEKASGEGTINVNGGHTVNLTGTLDGLTVTGGVNTFAVVVPAGNASEIKDCILYGNQNTNNITVACAGGATLAISGSTFSNTDAVYVGQAGTISFAGETKFQSYINTGGYVNYVTLTSGAILDLTGNANATPINPGGSITFAPGGATVYPSAGQASAYMLGGITVPTIGNANVVNLGGASHIYAVNQDVIVSGATVANGSGGHYGGCFELTNNANGSCHAVLSNTLITGGTAVTGAGLAATNTATTIEIIGCTVSNNSRGGGGSYAGGCFFGYGARATIINTVFDANTGYALMGDLVTLSGCTFGTGQGVYVNTSGITLAGNNTIYSVVGEGTATISSGASINLTRSIAAGGGIVVETGGCTVNGVAVAGGTYTSIVSSGGSAIVNS